MTTAVLSDPNGSVGESVTLLGTDGQGHQFTLVNGGSGSGITQLTGDVDAGPGSGSQAATVVGLQTHPVSAAAPAVGNVLTWGGASWAPAAVPVSGITQLTGDVAAGPGTGSEAATVVGLQTHPVSAAAPAVGNVLTWGGASWAPAAVPASGITQLTHNVLAGPGTGSQSTTVVGLDGDAISHDVTLGTGDSATDFHFVVVPTATLTSGVDCHFDGATGPTQTGSGSGGIGTSFVFSSGAGTDAVTNGNGGNAGGFVFHGGNAGAGAGEGGNGGNAGSVTFFMGTKGAGSGSGVDGAAAGFAINFANVDGGFALFSPLNDNFVLFNSGAITLDTSSDVPGPVDIGTTNATEITIGSDATAGGVFVPPLTQSSGGVVQANSSTGLLGTTGYREDVLEEGYGISIPNGPGAVNVGPLTVAAHGTVRIELFCTDLTPGETMGYVIATDTVAAIFIQTGGGFFAQIGNRSDGGARHVNYRIIQTSPG
jgi:hypothetical protein